MAELLTAKGTKRQFTAGPEGYPFPCTVIAGKEEGKTVLITAQIHSGEYPGTPALIRLAERLDPAELKGTLILIPCVNITGFYAGTNAYVPEDHGNLNAAYPGDPDTVTGRIAQYFVQELFPHADFVLDLHSGGMNEALTPCLFFPALKELSPRMTSSTTAGLSHCRRTSMKAWFICTLELLTRSRLPASPAPDVA